MLNIKKIRPMSNYMLVTCEKYSEKDFASGIIENTGLKEIQKVVAVGPMVRNVKEGDLVRMNPSRYAVRKHETGSLKDGVITDNPVLKYVFNTVVVDHETFIFISENDVDFVIEEYDEEQSSIIMPNQKILA